MSAPDTHVKFDDDDLGRRALELTARVDSALAALPTIAAAMDDAMRAARHLQLP
jgi:hypothetical protein